MTNDKRRFRCIKDLNEHNYDYRNNDYIFIESYEEFEKEGFFITYTEGDDLTSMSLSKGKIISYDLYVRLCEEVDNIYEFFQEITPAEEILKKIIKTLDNHSIVFSEDANGNNDYEEFGFVQTGFEENDFITFEEWKPTDEEIEYLKTLEEKK